MMGETVEQFGGHLGVAEDEVGGDDDRSALVEVTNQVDDIGSSPHRIDLRFQTCR